MRATRCAALLIVAVFAAGCGSDSPEPTSGSTTVLGGATLTTFDDLTNNHVNPPVSYPNSPSVGGDHYGFWQNCGFYEVELLEGAATHSLEHGVIWITYNVETTTPDTIERLRSMAADNDRLLISPYDHADPFVLSAWGAQLRGIASLDDVEVGDFIETYLDGSDAPEPGVRCTGAAGVPPDDIRTLVNGDQVPDEFT